MQVLPSAERGRFLAVTLLAIAVLVAYLLGVHWWFTARHLEIAGEMRELKEQERNFREIAAKRPEIVKRLADVRAFEASSPAFLPEADFDSAAAGLTQRLKQAVSNSARDAQSCQIIMNQYARATEKETYERVTIKVRMRCSLEEFAPILHELEAGSPLLFLEDLQIWKQTGYRVPGTNQVASYLDIRFDLYGYLRTQQAASRKAGPAQGQPAGAGA